MSFSDEYVGLIIKQYWDLPNASGEIALQAATWGKVFALLDAFPVEFDVDSALGDRLDILGRVVGVPRVVPFVVEKLRFGFDGDNSARGFADLFDPNVESAPFFDLFESPYTSQQLDDFDYRFFIRAKIMVNNTSAYMVSDEYISIQDVIETAFEGLAYVTDNKDMTLTLYVSSAVDEERLNLIQQLDLLPKPQGVRYKFIVQADTDAFGFADDPQALGFGDVFDPSVGGVLAELLI